VSLGGLSWYQTLFDKAVEIKVGYVTAAGEWIGAHVGGNFASTLGGSASIPYEMGMSASRAQPYAKFTWHINDALYNQFGAMRSLPIGGPTGSPIGDNVFYNPTGFDLTVPNGKLLLMDEFGYRTHSAPGKPSVWVRAGWMYNESKFADYKVGGTDSGISAGYIVADAQLMQFAPDSIFTAYRGLYAGGSVMFGPAKNLPFHEYYEGRLYITGPFDSRPQDQLAFVYSYNRVSKYLRNAVNLYAPITGQFAAGESTGYLVSYTAHLMPGVYGTLGLSYTDNPSLIYTRNEGRALNALFNLYLNM
jgi:porin